MPKKRTYNFKQLQGQASPKSKPNGRKDVDSSVSSVNERLGELRKIEGVDAAQKKRLFAESLNQPSVPPQLRGILGVPESAPPRPKHGARVRTGVRGTPGPAPPKSWLHGRQVWAPTMTIRNGGGKRQSRKSFDTAHDRVRPDRLLRFAGMAKVFENDSVRSPFSLMHLALKATAQLWEMVDEEDLPALVEVPLQLRLRLISYISYYGPAIDAYTLDALTKGGGLVTYLDLAGLLGHGSLTLNRLSKILKSAPEEEASINDLVQSWDHEDFFEATMLSNPCLPRFSSLTHLCLSHPHLGAARWPDLLSLAKHTPKLTHLSLAYWPWPTLTPNLATTTVLSRNSLEFNAGGSSIYSALDRDLSEPASVLRQLSACLLCLQWLDLEGCTDWFPALSLSTTRSGTADELRTRHDTDPWLKASSNMSIFADSWKNLLYINCSQGHVPSASGVRALPRQTSPATQRKIITDLLKKYDTKLCVDNIPDPAGYEVEKRKAHMWMGTEERAVLAGQMINFIRRSHNCKSITMDYGWCKRFD